MKPRTIDVLDHGGWRRLKSAWDDPELGVTDLRAVHRISAADVLMLTAKWGPKAKLGSISHSAINYGKRQAKRRAELHARANVCIGEP